MGPRMVTEDLPIAATNCNTLQHTASKCRWQASMRGNGAPANRSNRLQRIKTHATHYNTLEQIATHCDILQHTATHCNTLQHAATHYNTLQHTTTCCNTCQASMRGNGALANCETHYNSLHHPASHCSSLQHTATLCNMLQLTATHCNTLQHTVDVRRPCAATEHLLIVATPYTLHD